MIALNASAAEKSLITDSMTDAKTKALIADLMALNNDSVDIVQLSKLMSADINGVENYLAKSVADIDLGTFSSLISLLFKKSKVTRQTSIFHSF